MTPILSPDQLAAIRSRTPAHISEAGAGPKGNR